ncbi:MAG: PAS domain-containing protein, partial [Novosphingobium sp.]
MSEHPGPPSHEELLERQAFQLRLLDCMRRSEDAQDILASAAQLLGEHLSAGRCGFGTISEDGTRAHLDADWSSTLPSLTGETRLLDSFGPEIIEELRRGHRLVIIDSDLDARTKNFSAGWRSIDTRALIVCPIFRDGKLDSVLYVHDAAPRIWSKAEVQHVEDVALRTRDSVDRARSEAALRISEQRYRSLFNSIDAGFCVVEVAFDSSGKATDYRFIEVNNSFEAYTGITNARGRWMREIAPAHEQHWFDLYGRIAKTGVPERVELPAKELDDRWYAVQGYRVDDPARHHVAILFSDLTARRRTERALERSREELELAVRAAELGRFDYRPREGTLSWDDRCRALFGLSPGVSVTYETAFLAGLHPEDRDRADRAVAASLDPDGSHHFEVEYRTIGIEDGELRHISAHGLAFFDGRAPVRLIGTVQDVTSDREAHAALHEVSERLRLAGRATNDAVWDWDLRADHVTWNDALTHAYGHAMGTVSPTGEW